MSLFWGETPGPARDRGDWGVSKVAKSSQWSRIRSHPWFSIRYKYNMVFNRNIVRDWLLSTRYPNKNCHLRRHAVPLSSVAWRCLQGMLRTQAWHCTHFKADESFDIKNVHSKSKSVKITKVEGLVRKRSLEDAYFIKRHERYFFLDICK